MKHENIKKYCSKFCRIKKIQTNFGHCQLSDKTYHLYHPIANTKKLGYNELGC